MGIHVLQSSNIFTTNAAHIILHCDIKVVEKRENIEKNLAT